jgi:hypothetical protein
MELAWYMYVGFRKMKSRLEIIGRVELSAKDPEPRKEGIPWSSWERVGDGIIMQREWDQAKM